MKPRLPEAKVQDSLRMPRALPASPKLVAKTRVHHTDQRPSRSRFMKMTGFAFIRPGGKGRRDGFSDLDEAVFPPCSRRGYGFWRQRQQGRRPGSDLAKGRGELRGDEGPGGGT